MGLPVAMHFRMYAHQAREQSGSGSGVAEDKKFFQREELLHLSDFFGCDRGDLPSRLRLSIWPFDQDAGS
jgi:hypothetical protein